MVASICEFPSSSTITHDCYREHRAKEHPRTPDVHRKCSKRAFDGLVKIWRRELHKYDPSAPEQVEGEAVAADNAQEEDDDIADLGECLIMMMMMLMLLLLLLFLLFLLLLLL